MKRSLMMLLSLALCICCLMPVTARAETYVLSDTDMTISLDDTYWYVFTRDNVLNNPELEELGISYEDINNVFQEYNAYVDAILFYEDGNYTELLVRKKTLDSGVANLTNYTTAEVAEMAAELAKIHDIEDYSVYENQYKFARLDYFDAGYYICEFTTVVNTHNYTLTFQSTVPYTDEDYAGILEIVDGVRFHIDTSLKEKTSGSFGDTVLETTIIGAATGAVVGLSMSLIRNKRKKKQESAEPTEPAETL